MEMSLILFWIILVLAVAAFFATSVKTSFMDYTFVPRCMVCGRWRGPGGCGCARAAGGGGCPWARVAYVDEPFTNGGEQKADIYNQIPYHLLGDEMKPVADGPNERISCVNSRSCYATSFDRFLEQTGNFRQMTNNYKRGYPDSCSSPYQELVLSFYKASPLRGALQGSLQGCAPARR